MVTGLVELAEENRRRILIVEDEVVQADLAKRGLEEEGYHVEELVRTDINDILNNLEAKLKKFRPDIVVVDGLHGGCYDVIEKARRIKPTTRCIIRTADDRLREEAIQKGYEAVEKFTPQGLVAYLNLY